MPLARNALRYAASHVTSLPEAMRVTAGLEERELDEPMLDEILSSEEAHGRGAG